MGRTDGEITVEEPNGEEAVGIDIVIVATAIRSRLADNAVATPGDEVYRGSRRRVPQSLIDISPIAIAPEMVSIGPFYRGNNELLDFESYKWLFLNRLLSRTMAHGGPDRLRYLVKAVQKLEDKAKAFYDEVVPMSSQDFIEMMVLDGCFIIELFRYLGRNRDVLGHDDPISVKPWLIPIITRDLLKLENQLPFFVLEKLFKVTAPATGDPLALLALKFFNHSLPRPHDVLKRSIAIDDCSHLLGLFHSSFCSTQYIADRYKLADYCERNPGQLPPSQLYRRDHSPPQLPEQSRDYFRDSLLRCCVSISVFFLRCIVDTIRAWFWRTIVILRLLYSSFLYCLRWIVSLTLPNSGEYRRPVRSIQSTTQLRPSGVKFKPHRADSFLEINFTNRVLKIPPIPINDLTITVFINCIAYENCSDNQGCFTHYIAFLSCLINSPKDAAFLCAEGIIASYSHNDHYIAGLFSKLGEKVYFRRYTSGYLDWEFRAVEAYYNSHRGTFMRTYFSTPWAFISVVSAVILLVFTGGQTLLAVLSYIDQRGKHL